MNLDNLISTEDDKNITVTDKIHIRIKKRNGRKSWTYVEGLPNNTEFKKDIIKPLKKKLCCAGSLKYDDNKPFLEFQGDHRDSIKKFIIEKGFAEEKNIAIHGY
ncbi:MAG: stress response translation initiation inhibitor YciH [Magnetococcales bacterium]|nr:stress response translation initiation inhibitor YciH [Magnetococcales bacterium]|tara:strand:- start:39323 stop:39634 length:312 start_codon:yes stop_codon:yes gene_type:complete